MTVTQRGDLDDLGKRLLAATMEMWAESERMRATVREQCVEFMEASSIRAVAELTGFSTNTLQRWKREAGK